MTQIFFMDHNDSFRFLLEQSLLLIISETVSTIVIKFSSVFKENLTYSGAKVLSLDFTNIQNTFKQYPVEFLSAVFSRSGLYLLFLFTISCISLVGANEVYEVAFVYSDVFNIHQILVSSPETIATLVDKYPTLSPFNEALAQILSAKTHLDLSSTQNVVRFCLHKKSDKICGHFLDPQNII